jgi:hypothetical protein
MGVVSLLEIVKIPHLTGENADSMGKKKWVLSQQAIFYLNILYWI